MRRRSRLVGVLWHWHRRVGLLAAVFVVVLAATGIALNHSSLLGLDSRFVESPWLAQLYGDDSPDLMAFRLGEQWVFRAADGRVYVDTRQVAPCSGKLVGAVAANEVLLAGCAEELLIVTPAGELLESVSASTGLPTPLQGIGLIDSQVALQADGIWWLADLEQMDFSERVRSGGSAIGQRVPDTLPADIRAQIPAPERWLSWERLLLDLHSGRLFGQAGVWVVDAVGVLLITLASSGTLMWWFHRRRGRGA
jgi:hypothetical protein